MLAFAVLFVSCANKSYCPPVTGEILICCKGWLFIERSNRLPTLTDLARQSVMMVTGKLLCKFGRLTEKFLAREWPGVLANSSPYHSLPLDKKLTVSSS